MLDYIKSFLTLFLLVKILLYIVPKKVFEKYISFFAGVILVIGLLYPLLKGMGQEEKLLQKLSYKQWEKELSELEKEALELQETGEAFLEKYYSQFNEEASEIESITVETVKINIEGKKYE